MLSNLVNQLKEAGKEDKFQEVLEEIPRVRKDFGEPPLVTPSSQIVGTQAVMNVISGERYKLVPKESKKIMMGEFGQTVTPVNKEVQKKKHILDYLCFCVAQRSAIVLIPDSLSVCFNDW